LRTLSRRHWIVGSLATCASLSYAWAMPEDSSLSPLSPVTRAPGETNDTKAIQRAIDAVHEGGGGTVHIPAGNYVCGSLLLHSNISLWLDNGATLNLEGVEGARRRLRQRACGERVRAGNGLR
jgi:hypothetical protein